MAKKKFFIMVTGKGKQKLMASLGIILVLSLVNALIFAAISNNPLEGRSIIIDPGHGGVDGGTNDEYSFFEKEINLQISGKIRDILLSDKAAVDMTRETDTSLDNLNQDSSSRHERDLMARVNMFNSGKYDMFVSIHVDRSSNSSTRGPIVFYCPGSDESQSLAGCIQESLNRHVGAELGIKLDRLPVKYDYYILKNSNIPGVIVETGFISNAADKKLLQDENYQLKLAKAVWEGIKTYLGSPEKGKSYAPEAPEEEQPFNVINEIKLVNVR